MPSETDSRVVLTCPPDTPNDVRAEFENLVGLLADRAEPIDAVALLMLATNTATWRAATAAVQAQGIVVNSGGVAVVNPYHQIAKQAQAQIVTLSKELCLTPATRKKKRNTWTEDEAPLPPVGRNDEE